MSEFKVKFNMTDYRDIFPADFLREYLKHDEILNYKNHEKGNIDLCIWNRITPTAAQIQSKEWRGTEVKRILKTGVVVAIKDEILWVPPNYYYALQYGYAGSDPFQFRLKRLKHVYFKIRARNNPGCKGTFTVKNRQDGETTMSMYDSAWETFDGNMSVGQIGIQSKTRADAVNPCWMTVQNIWQMTPAWIKRELWSDFTSGKNIAEKMQFMREANEDLGIEARNIIWQYYPAVFNAMDGKNNMKKCILDEVLKWVECDFGSTLTNYSKFIMPGFERRGMFDIFSSPPEKDSQSYKDGYELWKLSNPDEIDPETGTTASRIHRYYSNPLEGIQGAYDKWGDADPDMIYAHIMRERKNVKPEKQLEEVRGFPLNDEEIWGSIEGTSQWSNHEGIKNRSIYLIGTKYKDEATKEPKVVYGNLERVDGYIDGDVEFRQADIDHFDLDKARFAFSYIPQNKAPLFDVKVPPKIVENCIGVDPFNYRYNPKNPGKKSMGAMVNRKFLDIFNTGIKKVPTMIYCCRPSHQDIFFEDVIKAAIFNRSLIQYENRSDKLANYIEDRGYFDWLLPERGATKDSKRKGDAPSSSGKFLDEGIALIDAATNRPLRDVDEYYLDKYWFVELLNDYLRFNRFDTHENDLTMADMQALIGIVKLLYEKPRQESSIGNEVLDYIFS